MLLKAYTWARVSFAELRRVIREEHGGVAAEYAFLITLIAIVIAVGAAALGTAINGRLNQTATDIGP